MKLNITQGDLAPLMRGWNRKSATVILSTMFMFFLIVPAALSGTSELNYSSFGGWHNWLTLTTSDRASAWSDRYPHVANPRLAVVSPEPDQLRIVDLRGVDCYPQPDQLEVCGAADTLCVFLFSKSEELLPDIRLNVSFDDGIEYAGFVGINPGEAAVFDGPETDVQTIDDSNPESPTFLISGITRDSGGIYLCLGIRAECGSDLNRFPPRVTFSWDYTTESGVFCEGSYTLPGDFAGNVITPRVQFAAPLPGNTNLNLINTLACNTINITQTTPGGSATGYRFTAVDYGFDEGIFVGEVRRNGTVLTEGTDYTIDPATGALTATLDLSDDPLDFNEVDQLQLCFTYFDCFPNVDFFPTYTVVTTCDGVVCTGPPDEVSTARLVSNFPARGRLAIDYAPADVPDNPGGLPSLCEDRPYVFDIDVTASNDDEIIGDITNLQIFLRSCSSPLFFLSSIQIIDPTTDAMLGVLPEEFYRIVTTDPDNANDANVAGTVVVNLRPNDQPYGDVLQDIDGDGFFDDLAAGDNLRLRITYDLTCQTDDAGNVAGPAEGSSLLCQFRDVQVTGRRDCNARSVTARDANTGAPDFTTTSRSRFVDPPDNFDNREGYDFGTVGNQTSGGNCVDRSAQTEQFRFEYFIEDNPVTNCPMGADANGSLTISIQGDSRITEDAVFSNFGFDSDNDGVADVMLNNPGDTMIVRPEEGTVLLTINGGAAAAMTGTTQSFVFEVTLDTAYCSPRQLLTMTGLVGVDCGPDCECISFSTSSFTWLRVDPDDCGCDCYASTSVEVTRISRGFTDATRTEQVPPLTQSDPDNLRFLPGDTIQLRGGYTVLPTAATSSRFDNELRMADRTLIFELAVARAGSANFSDSDNYPAVLDYQLTRLQSFTLYRDDGTVIDLAGLYSGTTQNLGATGLIVGGLSSSTTVNDFPQDGEITQPAFPDGGYTFSTSDDGRFDDRDGRRLTAYLRGNPGRNGEKNTLDILYDEIGEWLPGDSVEVVWTTVLAVNPGQDGAPVPVTFSPYLRGSNYIGDPAANITSGWSISGCPQTPQSIEFFEPTLEIDAQITYADGCDAELVFSMTPSPFPTGWYENELRAVVGLEQVALEIPFPYVYTGGASVETATFGPTPIFPELSRNVDTTTVTGSPSYLANGGSGSQGSIIFTDSEFQDSVRSDGYANFDNGEDDITTVGGTFPLVARSGSSVDTVTIRVPLVRICGEEPTGILNATYSWANRHLPDYEDFPYRLNTSRLGTDYWDGKVRDNDGNLVDPDPGFSANGTVNNNIQFYFPFQRLQDDPTDEVNPHRRIGQTSPYQIIDQPAELSATLTATPPGNLLDNPGSAETKTITITPDPQQTLTGAIAITVAVGGELVDITSGGASLPFTNLGLRDSLNVFSLPIPTGLAADESFSFDITTDLLVCEAVEICLTPVLGCDDAVATLLAVAFDVNCGDARLCYSYAAGAASVRTTIDEPIDQNLCTTQTFNVQYFNDGSSDLANFSPLLYIPEGLEVSDFSFSTTGGAGGPLTAPTVDPTATGVFGVGFAFDQAEIDAAVAQNGSPSFNPGQVLTITFEGITTCDFLSGLPLVSEVRANDACSEPADVGPTFSSNIDVILPDQPTAIFSTDADESPLRLSCSQDGDLLVVTALNVGKSPTTNTEICLMLPAGVSIDESRVDAIVPEDYNLPPGSIETTPINASGATMYCFDAPVVEEGGFICLNIPFVVGNIDCGPVYIGATLFSEQEVICQSTGMACDISVSTTEQVYFEIEVVPAVAAGEGGLQVNCTATPGVFDVAYDFDFTAESQPYTGDVSISLFADRDADGILDRSVDEQIGMTQTTNVTLEQDVPQNFSGVFPGVPQEDVCPLLVVIESLGCECTESVLPFPEVLPTFLDDLGPAVTLCPGDPFTFDGLCADFSYALNPPEAGLLTVNEAAGEVTVELNPGFGVESPVPLVITGPFGSCGIEREILVSQLPELDFGPYEVMVCSNQTIEVDLDIPFLLQDDIQVSVSPTENIENPNSVEPRIENLMEDRVYDVSFSLNDGQCMSTTTITATVFEPVAIRLNDFTGCSTGFSLSDLVTVDPPSPGRFTSLGDGTFTPAATLPGEVTYLPGPQDIERGEVDIRFRNDDPDGPCGPTVERIVGTILLVDCGTFPWSGGE